MEGLHGSVEGDQVEGRVRVEVLLGSGKRRNISLFECRFVLLKLGESVLSSLEKAYFKVLAREILNHAMFSVKHGLRIFWLIRRFSFLTY